MVGVVLLAVLGASRASAAVPPLVNYQGFLARPNGTPLNGSFPMSFSMYADSTGGAPLWTESFSSVAVDKGTYRVLLGSTNPLTNSVLNGTVVWLETSVNDSTLVPRRPIVSVPYAIRAAASDSATSSSASFGVNWEGRVQRTPSMTGTDFVNATVAGTNVCPAGYHPCMAWEVMVIEYTSVSGQPVFDQIGWVGGSFPTFSHMRSLASGQDSELCPVGSHLTKYPSIFVNGAIRTRGALHCASDASSFPVWCCKD